MAKHRMYTSGCLKFNGYTLIINAVRATMKIVARTNTAAMAIIVVSLTCTTYLYGTLPQFATSFIIRNSLQANVIS